MERVILFSIQILIRSNIFLPVIMGAGMLDRPFLVSTILAAPLATSVALLTAIPTSACFKAGESFTPSPVIPTICPFTACSSALALAFCSFFDSGLPGSGLTA